MSSTSPCFEVRLYGLHPSVTNSALLTFFSAGVTVLGTRIHQPNPHTVSQHSSDEPHKAWAQIWTASEAEVERCLELKEDMARKGFTIMRAPDSAPPLDTMWSGPHAQPPLVPLPLSRPPTLDDFPSQNPGHPFAAPPTPARDSVNLARNLYVLGIPIDMTQHQFKSLFVPYGMVEHSTLLSQLDGAGRRRGFVLMSTHHEASRAMEAMIGRVIDGYRIDVSWALVQRETKYFQTMGALPNRVVHPPTVPNRGVPVPGCTVLVENLNPLFFPNAGAVRDLFSFFGPVLRVTVLPGQPLTALLAFEHKVCADALVRANGMSLNGQTIFTRYLIGDSEGERNLDDRDDGEEETVVGRNAMLVSPGTGWDGVGATGQNRSFLARPPLPAAAYDTLRSIPPFTYRCSTSPLPSRPSTDSLNLDTLLRLDTAFAQAESHPQDMNLISKTNKLNPESQEFIPSDEPQDVNSSPSKGSSGTRVGSGSEVSAGSMQGSMKGWEAARKLWD